MDPQTACDPPRVGRKPPAHAEIDQHIGRRIRLRRGLAGLSQAALADRIGITFQQVQKYETGANAVAPARLIALASALDVPVTYFFDGLSTPTPDSAGDAEHLHQRAVQLLRKFNLLPPALQGWVITLTDKLAREAA